MIRYILFLLVLIAALMGTPQAFGQEPKENGCPTISVTCPDADFGSAAMFTANLQADAPYAEITFSWTSVGRNNY